MADEQTTQKTEEVTETPIDDIKSEDIDFTDDWEGEEGTQPETPGPQTTEGTQPKVKEDTTNDDTFDIKSVDIKGKWNDKEIPAYEMFTEALKYVKDNPEDTTAKEIIGNLQKAYDYTHVAETKKQLKAEKDLYNAIQLENYAMKYGQPPIEALYDPLAEINNEIEEAEDGKKIMVFNDRKDYLAYKDKENEILNGYRTVIENKKQALAQNNVMFENFSKSFPDANLKEVVEDVQNYLNPTVTMEQVPFPKDALEIFYKGKNFDTLLKTEVAKAVSKVYEELGIKSQKAQKPIKNEINSRVNQNNSKDDSGFDDAIDEFISGI